MKQIVVIKVLSKRFVSRDKVSLQKEILFFLLKSVSFPFVKPFILSRTHEKLIRI